MRTKKGLLTAASLLAAACMLSALLFLGGPLVSPRAQEQQGRVEVKTVQSFHTITGYFLDVNLTGMDGSVTAQEGDAFVLRIDNNNTSANTIFSFKLNGTIMSGSSSAPTSIYTYNGGEYVAAYSCGAYSSGYVPGGTGYTYLVIPASNFTSVGAVSSFSVSHRCAGAGGEQHKQLDYSLYGLYLASDFTAEGALDLASMQTLWTAAEDNFSVTVQNTAYTGSDYVSAAYVPGTVTYDYSATATPAEGGTVSFSAEQFNAGDSILVTATPDAGYELDTLTVNGADVTNSVNNNRYTAKNLTDNLTVTATFRLATAYYVEDGAITSIYNTRCGTAFAAWDAVNVMTVADMSSYPSDGDYQNVGITTSGIGVPVTAADYLAVRIYNLDAGWRTFYVMVNGGLNSSSGTYYMVDRLGNVTQKTGTGIITEKYTRFENATFDLGSSAAEGFSGLLIIPLANYGGGEIGEIENVTVYTGARDKSNARFNVGAMWVLSEFDGMSAPALAEEDAVWTPAQDNWSLYGDTAQFAQAQFLAEDDYAIRNVTVSPYYDQYYMTLPQNMIGSDGYVDLEALGVKGIAFDVENFNATQTGFAIRIAGSDNTNLTNTSHTLWQTSIAGGYTMKVIYDSGLVRVRAPAFLPYDESGSFSGTVYISLSNEAFTNIGGDGSFPTKIQPVMRLLFSRQDSDDSVYRANISNIRFITDETPFETGQITMTGIGGVIAGDVGGKAVGANSNNNVLYGTPVAFTVTPNAGYALEYVTYTMNDVTETAALDENNSFTVEVTGDIMVLFNCNEIAYTITYDLGGGTNNENNRTSYYLSDGTVRLYDPTREGYIFKGWQNEDGEIVTELDASAARDVTLTAVWEAENAGGCGSVIAGGGTFALCAAVLVGGTAAAVLFVRRKRNG